MEASILNKLKKWLKEFVAFYEQETFTVLLMIGLIVFLLITPVVLSVLTYDEHQRFLEFQRMLNSSWDEKKSLMNSSWNNNT